MQPSNEAQQRTARRSKASRSVRRVMRRCAERSRSTPAMSREADAATLLSEARDAGFQITAVDGRVPYLLHAKTGAAAVRAIFPDLPDPIVHAIECHTVGDPDMTDLDMVVYLADMLEPGRAYDGIDDLRAEVGSIPLLELFGRAYAASLHHLIDRRRVIHPTSVEVWNSIVAEDRR